MYGGRTGRSDSDTGRDVVVIVVVIREATVMIMIAILIVSTGCPSW